MGCLIMLDAFVRVQPPLLPDWLVTYAFEPPTWLMAIVPTPFIAMIWAYVLGVYFSRNLDRRVIGPNVIRVDWLGVEVSRPVLLAAVLFSIRNVLIGFVKIFRIHLVATIGPAIYEQDYASHIALLGAISWPFYALAYVVMSIWFYVLAGRTLISGKIEIHQVWTIVRGNWARLIVLTAFLAAVQWAVLIVTQQAGHWLFQALGPRASDTLMQHIVYVLVNAPLFYAYYVMPAIAVAIVLLALGMQNRIKERSDQMRADKPIMQ
jgi:hypothetical protein